MRNWKHRLLAGAMTVALLVGLLPSTLAVGGVEYISYTWEDDELKQETNTISDYTLITADNHTWSDGWYVVQASDTITIADRITVSGDVHLILADGAMLTASAGIQVQDDDNNPNTNSLTIYAQSTGENRGKLTANDSYSNDGSDAGIGGNRNGHGGTIIINGGTVTATSKYGAGIGSGEDGGVGGKITINGGNVTANSINFGAGIGGGEGGEGGEITINGGNVTATGGSAGGAGIGGGGGTSNGSGGTITISGGNVTSTGGGKGAGIGGGNNGLETLGAAGTFLTTETGNAFINASSIQDNDNTDGWSGVIFGGETDPDTNKIDPTIGKVYGSPVTLTTNAEIPSDKALVIESGQSLAVADNVTLTNSGIIEVSGAISGTLVNSGTIIKQSGASLPDGIVGNIVNMPEGGERVGAFIVVGGASGSNGDYTYENGVLTVLKDTELRIITHTRTTTEKIVVSAATANITLEDVNINLSGTTDACALEVSSSSTCNLTLVSASTLISGANKAGINVPSGAELTITSTTSGSLSAFGGSKGAGIGGNQNEAGGTITITGSAVVTANGGGGGNGIGNGNGGSGTASITINGSAIVTAKGSSLSGSASPAINGAVTVGGAAVVVTEGYQYANLANRQPSITGTLSSEQGSTAQIFAFGLETSVITESFKSGMIFHSGQAPYASYEFNKDNNGDITFGGVASCLVYGKQTLGGNLTINSGGVLDIKLNSSLEVPTGKTLTNKGSITGDGSLKNGGGNFINDGGTVDLANNDYQLDSTVTVSVTGTGVIGNSGNFSVPYGSTVSITATISEAATNRQLRNTTPNTVDFYLGTVDAGTKLNTEPIQLVDNTAELEGVEIAWMPNETTPYTITAVFGGSVDFKGNVGTANLTVTKANQAALSITGKPTDNIAYGQEFTLGTTGGSGTGAVTWAVTAGSNYATVDSTGKVRITGVGSVTIKATKAGDANYNDTDDTYNFTTQKATPDVGTVSKTSPDTIYPTTALSSITLSRTDTTVAGTLALDANQTLSVGTATYNWTFTPTDTTNYNEVKGTISLTVTEDTLQSIAVTTPPSKTTYTYGEVFNKAGMVVTATYASGRTEDVTNRVDISPDTLTVPTTTLTITYEDKTTTLSITVNKAAQAAAPAAPVEKSKTYNSVTLEAVADSASTGAAAQYSKDGGATWQDSPEFTGLTASTTYSFVVRYGATGNYEASPNSQPTAITTPAAPSSGGGGTTTYPPTITEPEGGTVTTSPKNPGKGDTVTITPKPDQGYEVDEITVTDKNGKPVEVTENKDGTFTFTQPSGKVTIEVTYKPIQGPEQPWVNPFMDVDESAWYYEAVRWAVENGVTGGTSPTTFSPNESCTRAQVVTFLWRAAGSPVGKDGMAFVDVDSNAYYAEAVRWAVSEGITTGATATTFAPDATVTRGQAVTFLHRAAGSPAAEGGGFADVSADAYYANAVAWAVAEEITNGTGATKFSPGADCTRAQIVTFLYRDAT